MATRTRLKPGFYMLNPKHFGNEISLFYYDGKIPEGWTVGFDGYPFIAVASKDKRNIGKPIGYLAKDMTLATNHEVIQRLFRS